MIGIKQNDMEMLKKIFIPLTAMEAVALLCQIFAADMSFAYIDARRYRLHDLYDDSHLCEVTADSVEIRFFGGPPARAKWFTGTLLTLLMDHAAYCLSIGENYKITEAIVWIQNHTLNTCVSRLDCLSS